MTLSEAKIMGGVLDDAAHAIYDTIAASGLLDIDEVKAAGNKTTPIKAKKIAISSARIDAAGIDPLVEGWLCSDRDASGKHAGGRKALLTRRQVLIMALTLADEGSKLLISEYANAFHKRLTKKARIELGVDHIIDTGDPARDYWNWYMRVARMLYATIGTFDAWPAPRRLMEREKREDVKKNRPAAMVALKEPRAREFTNTMLEMTLRALPLEYQQAWKGAVSVDQSAIAAPSQAMPWRRDHELEGSPEVFDEIEVERDGKLVWVEAKRPVMEIDATPYPKDKGRQDKDFNGPIPDFQHSYAANLMMTVNDPETPDAHPQLIVAASLHRFGRSIGEHTLAAVDSLTNRGWTVKRLTADRGYSAGIEMEEFHIPLAQRGIGLVIDYKKEQLGARKETIHGAREMEGRLYCPGTPEDLMTLSKDARDHKITPKEYFIKIEERKKYQARPKSLPDSNGGVRYFCPARGKSPTVTCPLVEMHAQASRNPDIHRPPIDADRVPVHPDLICSMESVMVEWDEGLATKQELQYASREWLKVYSHDRQSMEGMNAYLKRSHGLEDADRRMMRGLAAQSFILTMVLTAANFARINKFLHDRAAGAVTEERDRNRDKQGYSNYHRFYKKPKKRRGMTLKEKRAAAPKPAGPAVTASPSRRRGRKPVEPQ